MWMSNKKANILFVQVRYWKHEDKEEQAGRMKISANQTFAKITNLKGNALYHFAVKAYNTAGMGPSSAVVNITTRKPRESWLRQQAALFLNSVGAA